MTRFAAFGVYGVTALLCSICAQAQSARADNIDFTGQYVSIGLGRAQVRYDVNALNSALVDATGESVYGSTTNNVFSGSLQYGVQFNRYLALEVGFVSLGKAEYDAVLSDGSILDASTNVYTADARVVAIVPVSSDFALFGKLGVAYTTFDNSVEGFSYGYSSEISESKRATGATFGVGIRWAPAPSFTIDLGIDHFPSGDDVVDDINVVFVGVSYRL